MVQMVEEFSTLNNLLSVFVVQNQMHISYTYGVNKYNNVNLDALNRFVNQVLEQWHGILKSALMEYWPEILRRWMRVCLNIIDPKQYWDLSESELDAYGVNDVKYFCNWYGRIVEVHGKRVHGLLNTKKALLEYKLIKPKLVRTAYHYKDLIDDEYVNERINKFVSAVSKTYFNGYTEVSKILILISMEASNTDKNERCNWSRKHLVNGHNISNLKTINDRIRIIKNSSDPYHVDAYSLYYETLKVFNHKKQRSYSVDAPIPKHYQQ